MKNILAFFVLVTSVELSAAPYYRFWQGWKLDAISYSDFRDAIDQTFIPATVDVGAGKGLQSYLPVLLPQLPQRPSSLRQVIPDEIALVVYESEEKYRSIRSTPEGKAYGDLHWDYFTQDKGSKSTLPETYLGRLEVSHAYDVLKSDAHWQRGYAVYVVSQIKQDPTSYVNAMKTKFSKKGLRSYLVLVESDYVIEYQLWHSRSTFSAVAKNVAKDRSASLKPLRGGYGEARKTSPYDSNIEYGDGVNTLFE